MNISINKQQDSEYQKLIDQIGSYGKTAYPAYTLSGLFALSAPFGFAGGRDLEKIKSVSTLPNQTKLQIEKVAGKTISNTLKKPSSLPPFWQLAGFSFAFGGGGYIIDQGDLLNGTGTVTAWSGIYLFFNGFSAIRRPGPLSLLLATSTLAAGVVHGCYYFSRTSWKGAIPGLSQQKSSNQFKSVHSA